MSATRTCIEALISVLEAENVALGTMDLAAAGVLLERKHDLMDAVRNLDVAKDSRDDHLTQDALHRLAALADLNKVAIERAMLVQRQVTSLVAAATRKAEPVRGYGLRGQATSRPRAEAYAVLTRA